MNHKSVNANNKSMNGFFLTSRGDNEQEQFIFQKLVASLSKNLKDNKIRSSNVLENMNMLSPIIYEAVGVIKQAKQEYLRNSSSAFDSGARDTSAQDTSTHDNDCEDSEVAQAWMTCFACLSWYNQLSKKKTN